MNHLDFDDDSDSIVLIEEDKVEMQEGLRQLSAPSSPAIAAKSRRGAGLAKK